MKTIKIAGPIVDSTFDNDYFMEAIARGSITPSSYVLRKLYQAEKANENVIIEISSPGGNALAAGDIAIALKKYPYDLTIELGAFVASAACNLALLSGRKLICHENTILLLHSAWVDEVAGGPGALRDEADILDKINQPIIDILKAHGMSEEKIKKGFSEGRILTLDAKELLEYGFVEKYDISGLTPINDKDEKPAEEKVDKEKEENEVSELNVNINPVVNSNVDDLSIKAEISTTPTEEIVNEDEVDKVAEEVKEDEVDKVAEEVKEDEVDKVTEEKPAEEIKEEEVDKVKSLSESKIIAIMSETKDLHSEYVATKQGKDRLNWLLKHPTFRI